MTREEAILLSAYTGFLLVQDFSDVHKFCEDTLGRSIWTHEFADEDVQKEIQDKLRPQIMKLIQSTNALRPVSREQVEKVWKGEWIGDNDEKVGTIDGSPIKSSTCSVCGNWLVGSDEYDCSGHFCPACGRAMTDEAVQTVMERLEALYERNDD